MDAANLFVTDYAYTTYRGIPVVEGDRGAVRARKQTIGRSTILRLEMFRYLQVETRFKRSELSY
jgi:hypothetical protein